LKSSESGDLPAIKRFNPETAEPGISTVLVSTTTLSLMRINP
jgi:hypothetical protein